MSAADRRSSLVSALGMQRARIADACAAAGRDRREVTLVAVTKTFPASDIAALAALGTLDVGESRVQEAMAKLAELGVQPGLRWHLIGRLQTNKARAVAGFAHVVHSLDRPELAEALSSAVTRVDRTPLDVFVQVSLDGDPDRGGTTDPRRLADRAAVLPGLNLVGVMAVAPLGADPLAAYAELARVAADVQVDHPSAGAISAGMSGDLEPAIAHGATHVRIGSALLGHREVLLS